MSIAMGSRLKEARKWMGLTLREVGERMNLSRQRIHNLESCDYLTDYQIERISNALGVDGAWLRTGEGSMFLPGREVTENTQHQQQTSSAEKKMRAAERAALKPVRAEYVRNIRMELKITQKAFGEKIGAKQSSVSALENGKIMVSDEMMKRIEAAIPGLRAAAERKADDQKSQVRMPNQCDHGRDHGRGQSRSSRGKGPFITVFRSGLLISKAALEKLGDSGFVKVYCNKSKKFMAIMETTAGENGALRLNSNGTSCKLNNAAVRKVAEKLLGFQVGNKAYRVEGVWTFDEDDRFWLFDMGKAEEVTSRGR